MAVTSIPKPPPPKAPTHARDPIRSSQNRLRGKEAKGDSRGKDPKEETKGKDAKGENKGKDPKGDRKGKGPKGSDRKGGKFPENVEETEEIARIIYSSQTARGQRWAPVS